MATITIDLPEQTAATLSEQAAANGLTIEQWIQRLATGNEVDSGRQRGIIDWSQCAAVESVPGRVSGAWVMKDTRMPVTTIFENLEAGANLDQIMEWYPGLDRESVEEVIEFAVRSLDKPPSFAS